MTDGLRRQSGLLHERMLYASSPGAAGNCDSRAVDSPAVRAAAAGRTDSASALALAASDLSPLVRREVAANPAAEAEVLLLLAGDRDWRTRAAVAARRDAPAAAHRLFINDRAWQVLHALSENDAVGLEVWRAIVAEGSRDLRIFLAGQTFVPLEIAQLLLLAPETDVRRALATQTPHREVLDVLLADPSTGVRCDALSNSSVSHADTDWAVRDREATVRGVAVAHLPVRDVDLERLLKDRSEFVRHEAADRRASSKVGPDGRLQAPLERWSEEDALVESIADSIAAAMGPVPGLPRSPSEMAHWPATPRKPTMKWLKLFSQFHPATDEIPDLIVRLWKVARLVNRDPAWIRWWEPAPYRVLDVSFGPVGPPGNRPPADQDTLYASIADNENAEVEAAMAAMTEDAANQFLYARTCRQLEVTLHDVAYGLGLTTPPALPAPV